MKRANRYNETANRVIAGYYATVSLDEKREQQIQQQEEMNYWKNWWVEDHSSRITWLMEHKDLSFLEAVEKVREEEKQWEMETVEWLSNPENRNSEIYSDVYKDLYGVRPHGAY